MSRVKAATVVGPYWSPAATNATARGAFGENKVLDRQGFFLPYNVAHYIPTRTQILRVVERYLVGAGFGANADRIYRRAGSTEASASSAIAAGTVLDDSPGLDEATSTSETDHFSAFYEASPEITAAGAYQVPPQWAVSTVYDLPDESPDSSVLAIGLTLGQAGFFYLTDIGISDNAGGQANFIAPYPPPSLGMLWLAPGAFTGIAWHSWYAEPAARGDVTFTLYVDGRATALAVDAPNGTHNPVRANGQVLLDDLHLPYRLMIRADTTDAGSGVQLSGTLYLIFTPMASVLGYGAGAGGAGAGPAGGAP